MAAVARKIVRGEAPSLGAAVDRMARALERRAASGEVEALEELQRLARELPGRYARAVRRAHLEGERYSYGDLAQWLGVTRQAARQLAESAAEVGDNG